MGGTEWNLRSVAEFFCAHMGLNMDILPMDGDLSYKMEFCFHEVMSPNQFCQWDVRFPV